MAVHVNRMQADKKTNAGRPAAPRRKRLLMIAMVTLAVLALASVFVYAGYVARQPETLLKRALAKTLQAKSATADLRVTSGTGSEPATVLQLAGPIAEHGKFDLTGRYGRERAPALGLSLRSVDGKEVYVRLTDVGQLRHVLGEEAAGYGITTMSNPLEKLEGKWLIVPASLKDTVLQNRPADGKTVYGLSDKERLALAGLYQRHEFLTVGQVLPAEEIDGVSSHHYRLNVNSGQLRAYLQAVQKEIARLQISDKQIGSVVDTAARISDMEVWIGKEDNRLRQLQFSGADGGEHQTVRLGLRDFDRPVDLKTPAGAVPLFEALGTLNR